MKVMELDSPVCANDRRKGTRAVEFTDRGGARGQNL